MSPFEPSLPKGRELNGGDLLAQALAHLGVEVAFGLHGGHLDAFLLGAEEAGIRLIDTRHETVAVQAAEGYAKVAGRVGVCFVTANSGFCNGLPGLATAFADRSPILCITSSPPLQDAETNALQGFHDQVVLAKPITKFAHRVTNVEEIPRLVAYAFRMATVGAKGPVLLDLPIDILFTPPQVSRISYGALTVPCAYAPAPDPASLKRLIELWTTSQRPVIITGTGVRHADKLLTRLAEKTQTYVFNSNKLSSPIHCDHELRGGPATALAALPAKQKPDFVLLLGARTGFLLGGRSGAIIPHNCILAQVDLDGAEIGKTHPVEVGIVADVNLFLAALLTDLETSSSGSSSSSRDAWTEACRSLKTASPPFAEQPRIREDGRLHPWHAFDVVMRTLPPDSIIIIDGGEAGQWASMTAERAKPNAVLVAPGYLGFLGNGWGYSLGASIADPSRLVVNVHGDGSAGFHIQELDTFARFGLRVLTIVANNYVWGMSMNGQDLIYEGVTTRRPVTKLSPSCAYEVVAEGFNCVGTKVTAYEDIAPAVQRLTVGDRPGLINLIVSQKPTSPATLSMVAATDDPNVIVVPYYDNVLRPFYKQTPQANGQD